MMRDLRPRARSRSTFYLPRQRSQLVIRELGGAGCSGPTGIAVHTVRDVLWVRNTCPFRVALLRLRLGSSTTLEAVT